MICIIACLGGMLWVVSWLDRMTDRKERERIEGVPFQSESLEGGVVDIKEKDEVSVRSVKSGVEKVVTK